MFYLQEGTFEHHLVAIGYFRSIMKETSKNTDKLVPSPSRTVYQKALTVNKNDVLAVCYYWPMLEEILFVELEERNLRSHSFNICSFFKVWNYCQWSVKISYSILFIYLFHWHVLLIENLKCHNLLHTFSFFFFFPEWQWGFLKFIFQLSGVCWLAKEVLDI